MISSSRDSILIVAPSSRLRSQASSGWLALALLAAIPVVLPGQGRPPAGARARCRDGTYSFSKHHSGTCSHHGGVGAWLDTVSPPPPPASGSLGVAPGSDFFCGG